MYINEILPETKLSINVTKRETFQTFEGVATAVSSDDIKYIHTFLKHSHIFCVIKPILHEDKYVNFDGTELCISLLAHVGEVPIRFASPIIVRINLPSGTTVCLVLCKTEGRPFNRRECFRLWLGAEGFGLFHDSNAIHNILIKDICTEGISFIFSKTNELKIGDNCNIQFYDYTDKQAKAPQKFVVLCRVVHILDINERSSLAGCSITKTANNISAFINQVQRARMKVNNRRKVFLAPNDEALSRDSKLD